jgi:ankyrin repeat protein
MGPKDKAAYCRSAKGSEQQKEMNSSPVLLAAARLPAERVLDLLLQYGADPNLTNASGQTALFHAQRFEQPRNVKRLVQAGARTPIRDPQGHPPATGGIQQQPN